MTATAKTVHAFRDDALADHDAVALAALLRTGELSASEVTEAAIARAEAVNAALNAIHLPTFEQARALAGRTPAGVFADVPTFIKDNIDIAGLPTQHGSLAVRPAPAAVSQSFAQQYLAQGLVPLGKSSLPEFGFNASTEFKGRAPTRNPWHTDYSSGASSGGSAALVAAGVVPIAHANDGGGSIRIPAAACGLVGLKPTRSRLADFEVARVLPVNIVADGVVTRSVRDTAHFYAGAERFFHNRALPPIGLVEGPGTRRLRIGLVLDSITGEATDAETRATVLATARLLEGMGHVVEEMPLPITRQFADDFSHYWGMLSFLVSTFGGRIFPGGFDADQLDNLSLGLARLYRRNLWKTPAIIWRLRRSQQQYAEAMQAYDAVLSPVLAHTTPKLGWLSPEQEFEQLFERLTRYVSFTPLNNATGSPAISLPMGATSEGLPIAVHFSGRHGDERTLLELAYALEAAQPFRRIQDMATA